jgi:sec-independent protein translocase protein TatC
MKSNKNKGEMSFLGHLEELRWLLIRSSLAIVIFSIVAFHFDDIIFNKILLAPKNAEFFTNRMLCRFGDFLVNQYGYIFHSNNLCINKHSFQIINTNMSGQFQADMWISLIAGIIIAFPYIIWEIWRFIAPALYQKERKSARGAVFAISCLFLIGVMFGYDIISPLSVNFLNTYSVSTQIQNMINLNSYFSTIASVTLASGLIFELPIFAFFLAKAGVISAAFMRKYRRHAIIVLMIIAAIIAPPDVFSMMLVATPLYLLYEISIWIVLILERRVRINKIKG